MAKKIIKNKEKNIKHPMEDVLGVESGTTMVEYTESTTEIHKPDEYDDKDAEIDEQFQEIYDAAMDAFEIQSSEAELVEGKYKARNAEVAVQYLNAALNAAKEKSGLKKHKDKLVSAPQKNGNGADSGIHIYDRNELLETLMRKEKDITPK